MSLAADMTVSVESRPAGNAPAGLRSRGRDRGDTLDDGAFTRIVRQMTRLISEAGPKQRADPEPATEVDASPKVAESAASGVPLQFPLRQRFAGTILAAEGRHSPEEKATGNEDAASDDVAGAAAVIPLPVMRVDDPAPVPAVAENRPAEAAVPPLAAAAPAEDLIDSPPAAEDHPDTPPEPKLAADQPSATVRPPASGAVKPPIAAASEEPVTSADAIPVAAPVAEPMASATIEITARETYLPPLQRSVVGSAPAAPDAPAEDGTLTEGGAAHAESPHGEIVSATPVSPRGGHREADADDERAPPAISMVGPAGADLRHEADSHRSPAPRPAENSLAPAVAALAAPTATPAAAAPALVNAPSATLPDLASSLAATLKGAPPSSPVVAVVVPPMVIAAPGPVRTLSVTLATAEHGTLDVRMSLSGRALSVHLRAEPGETVDRLRKDQTALADLLRDHGYEAPVVRVEARHTTAAPDPARPDAQAQTGFGSGGTSPGLAGGGRQAPAQDQQPRGPNGLPHFDLDETPTVPHETASAAAGGASGLYL